MNEPFNYHMCGTEGVTKKWKQMEYLLSLSDIPTMAAAINKAWDDNNYCPRR